MMDKSQLVQKVATRAILVVCMFLLMAAPYGRLVNAQESQSDQGRGFTVSPLIFELSANPGDALTQTLTIDNTFDSAISITADLRNFVALGEEGQPSLTEESTSFSLASWMSISPVEAIIPSKKAQSYTLTINTPVNAEPGGHFGSVVFKTKPSAEPGNVSIVQEVGSLVLLRVAGDSKEGAQIESFKVTPGFSEKGPFNFETRIKNTGNVHFKPTNTITITNMFGKEVTKIQNESRNVLPDSVRKFNASFERKWLWGRHTATLTTIFGTKNEVLVTQITFWAFPVKFILIILGSLVALFILGFLGRKRLKRAFSVLFGKD